MSDKEQLETLYRDMYRAMISKDEGELTRIHHNSFALIHMTGMRQGKREYIAAIMRGTLNYYSEETASIDVNITGDSADIIGHSVVNAAVFGGGRHTWNLALNIKAKKTEKGWRLTLAQASTW